MRRRPGGSSGIHGPFLLFGHAGCFVRGDVCFAKTQVLGFFCGLVGLQLELLLLGCDCSTLDFFGGERMTVRSLSSSNFSFGCFSLMLFRLRYLGKFGGHDFVQLKVMREVVHKRQNGIAIEQQASPEPLWVT